MAFICGQPILTVDDTVADSADRNASVVCAPEPVIRTVKVFAIVLILIRVVSAVVLSVTHPIGKSAHIG
jgi:hypothetical protein